LILLPDAVFILVVRRKWIFAEKKNLNFPKSVMTIGWLVGGWGLITQKLTHKRRKYGSKQ